MTSVLPDWVSFVEVKASFPDPEAVRDAFGLPRKADRRRTLSFLDAWDDDGGLCLLSRSVILRIRQKDGGDGDSTVKLRPADPAVLTGDRRPAHDGEDDYKIEGDWARTLVLSASQDGTIGEKALADVVADRGAGADRAFTPRQRAFLAACLPAVEHPLDGLLVAGPVRADRWDVADTGPFAGKLALRAERWRYAGSTEFMEVSARVPRADAGHLRDRLLAECSDRGLSPVDGATTKTETVLRDLLPAPA